MFFYQIILKKNYDLYYSFLYSQRLSFNDEHARDSGYASQVRRDSEIIMPDRHSAISHQNTINRFGTLGPSLARAPSAAPSVDRLSAIPQLSRIPSTASAAGDHSRTTSINFFAAAAELEAKEMEGIAR